jgi:putative transposase
MPSAARNLLGSLDEEAGFRFLLRDHDSTFTRALDDRWRAVGAEVIGPPDPGPNANAVAERGVGTVRRECLDHLLLTSRRHLLGVLHRYLRHDNRHRPHPASSCRRPSDQRAKASRDRQPPSRSTAAMSSAA